MIKEVIATGKDVVEAKENARAALGADPLADVNFEVLHFGSRGIFGIIGVKPAQVRAYIELPDQALKRRSRGENRNSEAGEQKSSGASEAKQPREQKNDRKRRKPKSEKRRENRPESAEKEKSIAIPELELKFEKLEVAQGEDMSFEFVKTLIADIGLNATAELYACEDGTRRITINGEDAAVLIGHHGDTLDALQYLTNLAAGRKNVNGEKNKSRVTIDIEGYRAKREATLRALARRMAAKALRNKRSVMLEPMNPYERRIIHSEIHSIEGVSTNSIGSDNNRKIVIYLTDKKPKGIFEEEPTTDEKFSPLDADVEFAPVAEENLPATVTKPGSADEEGEAVSAEIAFPVESEEPHTEGAE